MLYRYYIDEACDNNIRQSQLLGAFRQIELGEHPSNEIHEKKIAALLVIMPLKATNL